MKSTQKKPNKGQERKSEWQVPDRAQVYLTPGAQKSLEEAEKRGEKVRIATDRPKTAQKKAPPSPQSTEKPQNKTTPEKKSEQEKTGESVSLTSAILAELGDRAKSLRLRIQLNSEDIIKGCICGALMILFALLQTTFFARFAPFGKVPDLMLVFVIAVGVYEGEKWGCVIGLASAFIIQALGSGGNVPEILSLVYMPAGCMAGLLSKYYLRHTLPVNAVYIAVAALLRGCATVLCAAIAINAPIGDIILRIALPEYFSTVIISPIPFLLTWLSLRPFHKTRAERTDSRSE